MYLGNLDHGVGHLGRVRAGGLASETCADGGIDHAGGLLALCGLEGALGSLLKSYVASAGSSVS